MIEAKAKQKKEEMVWSGLILFFMEAYIEITLSSAIAILKPGKMRNNNILISGEVVSLIYSWISLLIVCIILPAFSFRIGTMSK